ncbi:MAG: hypothetical protein U0821_05655 [Chloroflexota bacterium]
MPGTPDATALMYVHMSLGSIPEDEFSRWYDKHAPARLAMPGVLTARRYWSASPHGPRHLAMYDLAELSALESPDYLAMRADERPRDREFMGRLTLMDRRVYRALDVGEPWAKASARSTRFLISMTMDIPVPQIPDYHAWYLEEHIPMLLEVPGWRRIRRFQQVCEGHSFLALHDVDSLDVFETPEFKAAVGTPWRDRVLGYASRRERLVFELAQAY